MNPKIEDLRKKAFMLYGGPHGVDLVNKEVKRLGIAEGNLNEYQLKIVLNNIIKGVFIDYVGLDKTKELLAKEVTHVPGYHMAIEEENEPIHILERFRFMRVLKVFLALSVLMVFALGVYYVTFFNTVELCEKKQGEIRDACFLTLAMHQANLTFCDKLSTAEKAFNCYGQVGIKLNRTDVCEEIPPDEPESMTIRDKCVMCVAFKLSNKSMCGSFINPMRKDECITQIERHRTLAC
jgi:hypothetical protein